MGFWIPIDPKKQFESIHSRKSLDRVLVIRRNGGAGTYVLEKYEAFIRRAFMHKVMQVPSKAKVVDNSKAIKKLGSDIAKLSALVKAETEVTKKQKLQGDLEFKAAELRALKG